jgi:hypothetical protein
LPEQAKRQSFKNAIFATLAGVVALVVAIIMQNYALTEISKQKFAHETYVETKAQVVRSMIIEKASSDEDKFYIPYIKYEYEARGKSYQNDTYWYYGYLPTTKKLVTQLLSKYPVGAEITAYYDSEAPHRAVLNNARPTNQRLEDGILFLYIVSPILMILGIIFLIKS